MNELQPQNNHNACLDRGLLVSLRDGELPAEEKEQALAHLATCPDCAADERSVRATSQEMYDLLNTLEPSPHAVPETRLALAAFQTRLAEQGQRGRNRAAELSATPGAISSLEAKKSPRHKRWWIAAAAAALIALLVLPNAGALASQFLALFHVQQFQPVAVNPESFRNGIGEDLQSFGDLSITSGNLNGNIQHPTQAQVQKLLNFKLSLPTQLPAGVGHAVQFTLIDNASGTFTFNAAKTRAYLAQTGQGGVSVPSSLDGATFTITLAPGVIINYGDKCQQRDQSVSGSSTSITSLGCSGGKPFYIAEVPSPVIKATGKASLNDLRSFVLSLPKLSPGARLLLQNVNLDSGVVPLPIPPQVQAQQVTIHGVQGVLMTDSSLSLGAALWQTNGIVYVVAGATSDSAQLMNVANSLGG